MRYIEMNPVRAGMVKTPGEYQWSSYLTNISGCGSDVIGHHGTYLRLGSDAEFRGDAYRELFRNSLEATEVHAIRTSVQTGTPPGNDRFRDQVEEAMKRKVGYAKRGRPRKKGTDPF
jgi:putative transposase